MNINKRSDLRPLEQLFTGKKIVGMLPISTHREFS